MKQAQAAAIEGVRRLQELGVPTKRPDDYYAEMAKSDQHMQKVLFLLTKMPFLFRSYPLKHSTTDKDVWTL